MRAKLLSWRPLAAHRHLPALRRPMYTLDAEKIEETISQLQRRIAERFPESGLSKVCLRLLTIGQNARQRSKEIARPNRLLRIGVGIFILLIVAGAVLTFLGLGMPVQVNNFAELVQAVESGTNDIIFIAIAIFFLTTLETRLKRRRALAAIHELRAIAHVIDMHQLTKDPERAVGHGSDTTSSPKRTLTPFELGRYLDYCSEMLALVGKIAAVYVQHFDDAVVLEAANEVEDLTTGLSQKIWQKITLVQK